MFAENLFERAEFDTQKHVEKILTRVDGGDVSVAAWEPGQISPFHCHPHATETYFCLQGGGTMKTLAGTVQIVPGSYVLHPPGELHEYENGSERTLLFRVRYGSSMISRHLMNRGHAGWTQSEDDRAYFTEIGIDPAHARAV